MNELISGLTGGVLIIVSLIALAIIVFFLFCNWKLFQKAGKEGWKAIIPIYSSYVLVEIAGLNWWYFLLLAAGSILSLLDINGLSSLATLAELVGNFFVFYNLAKKMHRDTMVTAIVGAIFPWIMVPILALTKDCKYGNSVKVSPNGPIEDFKK